MESQVQIADANQANPKIHIIYLLEKLFVILKPLTKNGNKKFNLIASVPVWKGTLMISDYDDGKGIYYLYKKKIQK